MIKHQLLSVLRDRTMKQQCKVPGLFRHQNNNPSGRSFRLLPKLFLALVCVLGGMTGYAQAACPEVRYVYFPSTIEVDSSLPLGGVIASATVSWGGYYSNCSAGWAAWTQITYYTRILSDSHYVTVGDDVFSTNVPGIGFRGHYTGGDVFSLEGGGYWPGQFTISGSAANFYVFGATAQIDLIKTGPITKVTLPTTTFIRFQAWSDTTGGSDLLYLATNGGTTTIEPKTPSCTTTTPVIPVTLNTAVSGLNLKNAGDTTADKQFKIQLNCPEPANLSLQFSGDFVNASQAVYKNTDATTGSSVGIQILKDGNPVPNGSGNKISLGTVTGDISPEFTARYYALTNKVVAGDVTSVAFAEISYN